METLSKYEILNKVEDLFLNTFGVEFKPARVFGNCVYKKDELVLIWAVLANQKTAIELKGGVN